MHNLECINFVKFFFFPFFDANDGWVNQQFDLEEKGRGEQILLTSFVKFHQVKKKKVNEGKMC